MLGLAWMLGFIIAEYGAARRWNWPELAMFPTELKTLAAALSVMAPGILFMLYAPGDKDVKLAIYLAFGVVTLIAFAYAWKRGWMDWLDQDDDEK